MVDGWNPDFIITTGDNNYGALTGTGWSANAGIHYGDYMLGDTSDGANRYTDQISGTQRFFPSLTIVGLSTLTCLPAAVTLMR